MGVILGFLSEPHSLEDIRHRFVDKTRALADYAEREGNVVEDRFLRQKSEVLENDAKIATEQRDLAARDTAQILAQHVDIAGVRTLFFEDEAQKA